MKLVIERVRFKNFLATGDHFTEIDFVKSVTTLIIGNNGDGKSTFMDALSFGLFNKAFRNINKNQLVNSINKKGLLVEVEFSTNKHKYLVRRGIKPAIFEIFQDGNLVNQNADSRDYQEILEKQILKLTYRTFTQTVVVGSAMYTPFMQLVSQHRRAAIEDLLDIQVFSTMNVILKGIIQQNRDDLQELETSRRIIDVQVQTHKKHSELAAKNFEHSIGLQEELIQKKQELFDQAEIDFDNHSSVAQAVDTTERVMQVARDVISRDERKYNQLIQRKQFSNTLCDKCGQNLSEEHIKEVVAKVEEELGSLVPILEKSKQKFKELEIKLDDLQIRQQQYQDAKTQFIETKRELLISTQYLDILREQQKQAGEQFGDLSEIENQSIQLEKQKEELINQGNTYGLALTLLKDSGIKTRIIKQYIPIINKLINKYLAAMDFFVNFELDENFDETIKSRYRDDFAYNSFSEGEKFRIDFAIMFTWRAIAKMRNTTNVNLLILDEVFDSSLDAAGMDDFLKILHSMEKETNIFVISHKKDQLIDQFSNVIRFKKQKNFSTIVESE